MRRGLVFDGLLRFMDQQRRNNFSFFERCSQNTSNAGLPFIPYENLGTLELGGQSGNVGKEIYGAGECLWMYLMFEALGQVDDRELMLVNLDLLDTWDANAFPPSRLNFLLFNPTPGVRTATFRLPFAKAKPFRLTCEGVVVSPKFEIAAQARKRLLVEL